MSVNDAWTDIAFVETDVFTTRVQRLGLESSLRELQVRLARKPEVGQLDPGTGGLRKVRMPDPARGKGKRSGARVHYLWLRNERLVYLIFVYAKDEGDTLTVVQKRKLAAVVRAIKRAHAHTRRHQGIQDG